MAESIIKLADSANGFIDCFIGTDTEPNPKSPAHILGMFIANNIDSIVQMAQAAQQQGVIEHDKKED